MDCFTLFFSSEEKTALVCRNSRNLSTSGDRGDRQGTSDFALKHIKRLKGAKLRIAALGSKFQWLVWTLSQCFSAAGKN